jgi:DNA mismatch repair ATPase MutL
MTVQHRITSILSTLLLVGICSAPLLRAQQTNPSTAQQPASTVPAQTDSTQTDSTQASPAQPANTSAAQDQNTQAAPSGQNQPQPATQQPAAQQPVTPGTGVNPSQAPLTPVTTYPDASGAQQDQQSPNAAPAQTTIPEAPRPKPQTEPVGAATAESVPTTGGAAAKPAGIAIAPAKQHQTRSLLFKIGAVVAAGAALGTVYALSHGTSSTPPGTGLAGVTGR